MTLRENNSPGRVALGDLHVYNTLSRTKERFEPVNPPHVGIYVCGPTVYGDTHLGHAKSYISFDIIVRYLRYLGYKVRYVQNITDVGHLTDDADEGEDKVEREAKAAKVHPMQIAERFTRRYFEDMDALGVLRPDISPRASGHIIEQIEHTKRLIETGHAYEANGSVYFDVASWPAYGKLSGRSVEAMQAGARVEANPDKKHPADFALWKRAEPGHIMQWPSPWGMGYPGWHIECTVMSQKYLGETFDIHGGGIENQFPHHEDEIAQAEAATGKPFAKYWLHNNMVTVAGKKMGKSLGNFLTLRDAFKKWPPMVIRLFILQSHYRSPTDFSEEALDAAQEGYRRLAGTAAAVSKALLAAPAGDADAAAAAMVADVRRRFAEAMDDDFGTAGAVAVLFDLAGGINTTISPGHATRGTLDCLKSTFEELSEGILGLKLRVSIPHPLESYSAGEGGQALERMFIRLVREWINLREDARKAKNFAQADAIRERLEEIGIALEDSPTGPTWRFTFKRQKPERRV